MIEQPLEYSNDELFPYKSASGLLLYVLIDEQKFHFENV
jgi:hypothetical protein